MSDRPSITRANLEPLIEQERALAEAKAPPTSHIDIPIAADTSALVGSIIAQWAVLQFFIDFQIELITQEHSDLAKQLVRDKVGSKYQIGFLRDAAPTILAGAREGALKAYQSNLSTICRVKGVRDALAHGMISPRDAVSAKGLKVSYKKHALELGNERLAQTARQISECAAFFIEFPSWLSAPGSLRSLEAWRDRLPE